MGMIGGLFTKKMDPNYIDDNDLAKRGFNTVNANGAVQSGLNQADATQTAARGAENMGLGAAGQGFQQSNQANAGQTALANQLALRAAGKAGPSIAEQQLSQSLGQVQQQGAGSLAAARGVSPGTAARLISNNQTNAAQQAAGQGAILRSQEQQAAENQLANVLSQQRQGALGQSQIGLGGFGTGAQAGTAALGTAGAINQGQNQTAAQLSMANLGSKNMAEGINTQSANQAGMGLMSGAGAALGLAGGGEVPDSDGGELAGGYAQGGEASLAHALMHSHKALSSAHEHLARYAAGGEVRNANGSYQYPPMDVRAKDKNKPEYVPHNRLDVSPNAPIQDREAKEGQDSEGNEKKLHLAKGGPVKKPVYIPHDYKDTSPTAGQSTAQPGQEGTDSEGNKKELHLAGGGLIGKGIHALGQALGIGENDDVHAANTVGDKTYAMDPNGYNPQYGTGSTFGPDASDESDTSGGHFATTSAPPSSLTPNHALATPGQMSTPGFGLPMYDHGGPVPGKAQVPGNNLKNDTVPAMLSPGEVVLPRTVSHDPEAAAEFVKHINARRMAAGGEVKGYGAVLSKKRDIESRLAALEARIGRK